MICAVSEVKMALLDWDSEEEFEDKDTFTGRMLRLFLAQPENAGVSAEELYGRACYLYMELLRDCVGVAAEERQREKDGMDGRWEKDCMCTVARMRGEVAAVAAEVTVEVTDEGAVEVTEEGAVEGDAKLVRGTAVKSPSDQKVKVSAAKKSEKKVFAATRKLQKAAERQAVKAAAEALRKKRHDKKSEKELFLATRKFG